MSEHNEPVAWMNGWGDLFKNPDDAERGQTMQPLYTTPQQRTWVGLTNDEWSVICEKNNMLPDFDLKEEIEAKLKEKNT